MENIYKIENVTMDLSRYTGNDQYSDGNVENEILEALKLGKKDEMLHKDNRWPVVYHLSTVRHHLLDCINFNPNSTVLEIGCGCGAITGVLCRKAARVEAVEISPRRAEIAAYRNKEYDNLTIHVGNLNDMNFPEKFDYITLIGVLEYAGAFTKTANPWHDFLENCRQYLKPNGILIVAIENRLGMKYWSGAREDHTGKIFDGITGYQNNTNVCTFSHKELKDLLLSAGFSDTKWFYPYPDYKMPVDLYSDEYIPTARDLVNVQNVTYDIDRCELFSEEEAFKKIIDAGLFTEFSNSFLVLCSQSSSVNEVSQPLYVHHAEKRKNKFRIGTSLIERNGKKIIQKIALNEESKKHLHTIVENCHILNREYGAEHVAQSWFVDDNTIEMEYIQGRSFEELAISALQEEGPAGLAAYIQFYCDNLLQGSGHMNKYAEFDFSDPNRRFNMDTHLGNIIYSNGNYIFIDYEWLVPDISRGYLLWRMLALTFYKYSVELKQHNLSMLELYRAANISQEQYDSYQMIEGAFYRSVLDLYIDRYIRKRHPVVIQPK